MRQELKDQLYGAFVSLGAKPEFLNMVGSLKNTSDEDILSDLKALNNSKTVGINQIVANMNIEKYAKSRLGLYGIKTNYIDLCGMAPMLELLEDQIDRVILTTERKCWLLRKHPKLWKISGFRIFWCVWCEISSFVRNEIRYFRQHYCKRQTRLDILNSLEKELYDVANKIVGDLGPSTNSSIAANCEKYVSFAFRTKDLAEIKNVWSKWINAYVDFAKLVKPEGADIDNNPHLTIFWRMRPEIREHENEVIVYSRLLISRFQEHK